MNKEKNKQAATSKVQFDNGVDGFPSNVDSYDPLNVPGFTLPPTPLAQLKLLMRWLTVLEFNLENYEAEETPMEEITEEVEDEPIFELESTNRKSPRTGSVAQLTSVMKMSDIEISNLDEVLLRTNGGPTHG